MKGLLLVNLGTPDGPDVRSVRRFLRRLLSDPKVVDLPYPQRKLLVELVILPFRSRRSARAYQRIWTQRGSPLMFHGEDLARKVAEELGPSFRVELAMRYGNPSIDRALRALANDGASEVLLLPLYPQNAASTRGSTIEAVRDAAARVPRISDLRVLPAFFDHPGYVEALAARARPLLGDLDPEHVLFSFHGLPERQVKGADPTARHCLRREGCCDAAVEENRGCYRFHCHQTARAAAAALELGPMGERWSISFQSRMGREPWLRPFTDEVISKLPGEGVRRLAVVCPSFVADCLETIGEIGMEARSTFEESGGESFALVPGLNSSPRWVEAVAGMALEGGR